MMISIKVKPGALRERFTGGPGKKKGRGFRPAPQTDFFLQLFRASSALDSGSGVLRRANADDGRRATRRGRAATVDQRHFHAFDALTADLDKTGAARRSAYF